MQATFPAWPFSKVIREACMAWTLRNLDEPCYPDGEWLFIYNVVHCWARHSWTDYDRIRTVETREALHKEIAQATGRAFPWLRADRDPRTEQAFDQEDKQPLFYHQLGRDLSDIAGARSNLLSAIRDVKRRRQGNWRTHLEVLEDKLREAEQSYERLWDLRDAVYTEPAGNVIRAHGLCLKRAATDYDWVGLELSTNHIEATQLSCPGCGKRVWRTKR